MKDEIRKLSGKVIRFGTGALIVFKVNGKTFTSSDHNNKILDAYFHTGDQSQLSKLTNEVPF